MRRSSKSEPEEEALQEETKNESGEESGEDGEKDEEHTLLMNFRHRFESTLREPARMLLVRDIMISFDPASIYGHRAGFLKGLLVTAPALV